MRWPFGRNAQDTANSRMRRRQVQLALTLLLGLLLACVGVLPGAAPATHARPLDAPALTIVVPVPNSDNISEGPVGANVTVTAQNVAPGDIYHMGYATQSAQCQNGFQNLPETVQAAGDGAFTQTLVWPRSLNAIGAVYYICAQDTTTPTNSTAQSQQVFKVDAASPPSVTVKAVSASTPTPGATATPVLFAGGGAAITGKNFVPGGLTLLAYLLTKRVQSAADLQSTPLNTLDNSPIKSQGSGDVAATVQVPSAITPGTYFLYLVSNDTQGAALPSLMAYVQVAVAQQPTVTPTVAPTSTPKAGGAGGTGNTNGYSPKHIAAIVGLAALSLILIVVGIVLLASAAGMPRQAPGGRPLD